jgi:predicted RecA/RadA family phage recombinase
MQNFVQQGQTLRYKNSGDAVIPGGSLIALSGLVGVAVKDIEPGQSEALNVIGVYSLPKVSGAIDQGAPVYVDESGKISAEASAQAAGVAWEAAASGDSEDLVKINFGFAPHPPPDTEG